MGMMQALQVEDYAMMAECMIDMGMTHGRDKVDTGELERDLTRDANADGRSQTLRQP